MSAATEVLVSYFVDLMIVVCCVCCVCVCVDENVCRVVTGSFDKRIKLWTGDGKLVHNIHCR